LWAVAAGVTLGLSLYAYYAARIIPVIILPIIIGSFLTVKKKKFVIKQIVIIGITTFCIMLPQLAYFAQHSVSFSSRTKEVFIFSNDIAVKEWRKSQYGSESMVQIIFTQLKKAIHVENGDTGGQYGYKGWLLDPVTVVLFLLGLVVAIKKGRKKFFFLLYWFLLTFIAGVILTIDPIFVPRFVIGLPVIFIFSALGFDYFFTHAKRFPYIQGVVSILILLIIIFWNLHAYFVEYPQQLLIGKAGDKNALNATNIAYYLNSLPSNYKTFFLTPPNLYADFATLEFLSPQTQRFNIQNPAKFIVYKNCPVNTVYIIYPSYEKKYQALRDACPYATFFVSTDPQGAIAYYVLQTTSLNNTH
jgi:hydrogenase/urease accessory protein HupE